jgi:hypothetical protein
MSFSSFITINKLHIGIAGIMKINELLLESKQLDEGPITQAIGRGAGKVAKGVSNIGKELKTGFKAGYNDQPTDNSTGSSSTMQGVKAGLNKAFGAKAFNVGDNNILPTPNSGDYGQLSNDESKIWNKKTQQWEPYDKTARTSKVPTAQQADQQATGQQSQSGVQQTTTPNINRPASTPVKNVADFGTIQRSIKTLSPRQKAALVAQLSGKPARRAPTQAEIDADRAKIMGPTSDSIIRTAKPISESFSLYRKQ